MKHYKKQLFKAARQAHDFLSNIKNSVHFAEPLLIMPYRGYASESKLFLKGRVMENENILVTKTDSEIRNLLNSFKRLETDEAPGVQVNLNFNGQQFQVYTDEEGYFEFHVDLVPILPSGRPRWLEAEILLPGLPTTTEDDIRETAEIMFVEKNTRYGIITDIDDTVLQTHVTSLFYLKMLYVTLFSNAHHRLPMEGIVEVLHALATGKNGDEENPVFYVSSGPWNIYDMLEEFMELQNLPKGPVFLRDYGFAPLSRKETYRGHKIETISQIFETFPDLSFIMLGDTAAKDADIYLEIAKLYPSRIRAIYIRKTKDTANARRIAQLLEKKLDVETLLINSSTEIFAHARGKGFVQPETVSSEV